MDYICKKESGREIYLAIFNRGLWKLNKENRQLIPVLTTDEKRNPLHIHRLVRSAKNEIWIGSEVGLYIYEEEAGKSTHFQQSYIDRYALSDNAIYCFCKDREGKMWLGTYTEGLDFRSLIKKSLSEEILL